MVGSTNEGGNLNFRRLLHLPFYLIFGQETWTASPIITRINRSIISELIRLNSRPIDALSSRALISVD